MNNHSEEQVNLEFERRYGYFRGEHPDRSKIRALIECEPMARWLALREIRRDLSDGAAERCEGRKGER